MRKALFALLITLGLNLGGAGVRGETKEQSFWRWFEGHEDALFNFEKNQEQVFDEVAKAMNAVHRDLTFEFGPVIKGRREFVISAAGLREGFPAVAALHAAAPKLRRWIFVKFRPRRTPLTDVAFAGRRVRAADVRYLLFPDDDPRRVGIMLFLAGYDPVDPGSVWKQIGFLFLDHALGEYAMETDVGAIVFGVRDSKEFERSRPLSELQTEFDEQMTGRRGPARRPQVR